MKLTRRLSLSLKPRFDDLSANLISAVEFFFYSNTAQGFSCASEPDFGCGVLLLLEHCPRFFVDSSILPMNLILACGVLHLLKHCPGVVKNFFYLLIEVFKVFNATAED